MHHYDTCSQIVTQAGLLLAGMHAEIQAGKSRSEHPNQLLEDIVMLLDRFKVMRKANFTDTAKMQNWLHDLADILPQLWD